MVSLQRVIALLGPGCPRMREDMVGGGRVELEREEPTLAQLGDRKSGRVYRKLLRASILLHELLGKKNFKKFCYAL